MKTLPLKFKRDNFLFTQRQRVGDIAIYGKRHPDWQEGVETYEIVRIRNLPERVIMGRTIEAGEAYPSSEQWGILAYTSTTFSHAQGKAAWMATQTLK